MSDDVKLNDGIAFPSPDALSGAMEKLLAHPELISMVASALGGQSAPPTADTPQAEAPSGEAVVTSAAAQDASAGSTDLTSALLPMLTRLGNLKASPQNSPHSALLCALKPYVSPARREAIDYFMKFSQMSALISGLK